MAIITITEKNKRPDEAIKDYINKNFATAVEDELIKGISMKLLNHKIIDNRPTLKRNSYFISKKQYSN